MECQIIWTDSAIAGLRDLCDYIAQDNPEMAYREGQRILGQARMLAIFPLVGRAYRADGGGIREMVIRPYRVFYEVNEAQMMVNILHIWHGARDEPAW